MVPWDSGEAGAVLNLQEKAALHSLMCSVGCIATNVFTIH